MAIFDGSVNRGSGFPWKWLVLGAAIVLALIWLAVRMSGQVREVMDRPFENQRLIEAERKERGRVADEECSADPVCRGDTLARRLGLLDEPER